MLPIADENAAGRATPWVVYGLIAVNAVVFLYELALNDLDLFLFINDYGIIPREIADGRDLFTLLTSLFIHGGWFHIVSNMLFLWVFGDNIEDVIGHGLFLAFYLVCGIGAGGLHVLIDSNGGIPTVGASGAISGVLGAYVVLFPHGRIRTIVLMVIPLFFLVPAWVMIGFWIVIQFVNGFLTLGVDTTETGANVAYFAHIGGFVTGIVLALPFRNRIRHVQRLAQHQPGPAFERIARGRPRTGGD